MFGTCYGNHDYLLVHVARKGVPLIAACITQRLFTHAQGVSHLLSRRLLRIRQRNDVMLVLLSFVLRVGIVLTTNVKW